jgi:hypothetical protein
MLASSVASWKMSGYFQLVARGETGETADEETGDSGFGFSGKGRGQYVPYFQNTREKSSKNLKKRPNCIAKPLITSNSGGFVDQTVQWIWEKCSTRRKGKSRDKGPTSST